MDEINYKALKITETEANKVKIANSADRPNAFNSYVQSKMNAADVKKMFDKPFELAIKKHNALVDQMEANDEAFAERLKTHETLVEENLKAHETALAEALEGQDVRVAEVEGVVAQLRKEADSGAFKGEKGEQGEQGEQGIQGEKGDKGDAGVIEFIIVTKLPAEDIKNAIYLLHSTDVESGNAFDEYIYVNGAWEKIGSASVEINLEDYAKKEDVDAVIGDIDAAIGRIIAIQRELIGKETITFTIVDEYNDEINFTLEAEDGMTWGEWIESEYNTIGAYAASDGRVYLPPVEGSTAFTVVYDETDPWDNALITEVIIDGYAYQAVGF